MSESEKKNIENISFKDLIKQIKETNTITIFQFNLLKKFALIPGGFSNDNPDSNENQKIILKALIHMNDNEKVNCYKRHPSKKITDAIDNKIKNENINNEMVVLDKDIPRSIFYKWKENNKKINFDLDIFQKNMESFFLNKNNKKKYSYYQGYLDFCVFFYTLFHDLDNINNNNSNDEIVRKSIKLFTELYLKDYISPYKTLKKEDDTIFQGTLSFLCDVISLIDNNIGKVLKEDYTPLCMCLSWIITFFAHEIEDFNKVRRIYDYFLINDPVYVYILSGIIIVKNIKQNIKNILKAEKEDIFMSLKKININDIDFNLLIVECDKFAKNNENEIFETQEKNKELLYLIGDFNYRGTENIIYSFYNQKLPLRTIKDEKSIICSYKFLFFLFVLFIFVTYYFKKDEYYNRMNSDIVNKSDE